MAMTEYCQRLKTLADPLQDLGELISDCTLVLNLIHDLSPRFSSQAELLPLQVSFPTFSTARSALLLAKIRHAARASTPDGITALFVTPTSTPASSNSKGKNGYKGKG
ncbi:uncharacterized protein LOC107303977 [Oryza brachyantha]|uniref:Uncharacterized protein n=1 Tax=Oryza brachyantha TaxID=4533 RepID=J3LV48_ORYBR|nr:uncharacterized protein LOC107303977 [Oryza brachyantha]